MGDPMVPKRTDTRMDEGGWGVALPRCACRNDRPGVDTRAPAGFLGHTISSGHVRGPIMLWWQCKGTGQGPWVFKDTPGYCSPFLGAPCMNR